MYRSGLVDTLVIHANTNGVWPNFLVWSPPWLYASSVKNKKQDFKSPHFAKFGVLKIGKTLSTFVLQSNLVIRNFLVIEKLFLNVNWSLSVTYKSINSILDSAQNPKKISFFSWKKSYFKFTKLWRSQKIVAWNRITK